MKVSPTILKHFDDEFIRYGFTRNGFVWNKNRNDVVLLFELSKSSWSDQYSLEAGVILKKLEGDNTKLNIARSHFFRDVGHLTNDLSERKRIYELLNFENIEEDQIIKNIHGLFLLILKLRVFEIMDELCIPEKIVEYVRNRRYVELFWIRNVRASEIIEKLS